MKEADLWISEFVRERTSTITQSPLGYLILTNIDLMARFMPITYSLFYDKMMSVTETGGIVWIFVYLGANSKGWIFNGEKERWVILLEFLGIFLLPEFKL